MCRISSRWTFFLKGIFPVVWVGGVLSIVADQSVRGPASGSLPPPFVLIVVILMVPFGYLVMKYLGLFDLADEVIDVGDELIIRNGDQKARVPLSEISDINYSQFMEPWRVTLTLRNPSLFGTRVSFMPPHRHLHPIVNELIERVAATQKP